MFARNGARFRARTSTSPDPACGRLPQKKVLALVAPIHGQENWLLPKWITIVIALRKIINSAWLIEEEGVFLPTLEFGSYEPGRTKMLDKWRCQLPE
jgi:hypothetical protein